MVSVKKQAFLDRKRKLQDDAKPLGTVNVKPEIVPSPAPKKQRTGPSPKETFRKPTIKHEKPVVDTANKNSTLFVRNLSFKTTQEQLETFFSAVSPVKHTVIITNPDTKVSLGYGFVSFATPEDASLARSKLTMEKLDDRLIKIDFAEKRARKDEEQAAEKAGRKKERVDAQIVASNAELIVRNLSFKVRDPAQLKAIFAKFGALKEIRIPRGAGQKMMGFAFVVFKRRECATKAIEGANGTELEGRPIAVDWSIKKDALVDQEVKQEQEEVEIKQESDDEDDDTSDEDESEDAGVDEFDEVEEGANPSKDIIKNEEGEDEDDNDDGEDSEDSEMDSDSPEQRSSTVFVRNLLFETTEQQIYTFFREFGPLKYARLVLDHFTGRSRGSAFVCFVHLKDAEECLELYRSLPKNQVHDATSLLLSEERKEGVISKFILGGRLLDVNETLSKNDAAKRVDKNDAEKRAQKGKGVDKRNLFLLNEGRIGGDHPLLPALSESDKALRSASYSQRKSLVARNPGLHLSLSRLSIRNLPRHVGDKELKYLGRQSIVGFGQDVKNDLREPISKEEIARDITGNKGSTGVVKQAKVVFEKDGSRSRGYGFISFASHRFALMALRWLNARQIGSNLDLVEMKNAKPLEQREVPLELDDRKRRLIVEFAIENVSVVKRREDKQTGSRIKASSDKQKLEQKKAEEEENEKMTPEQREKSKLGKIISQKRMVRKNKRKA